MTTEEVEALLMTYRTVYDAAKGLDAAQRAGVEAVARAVRAQDAARGGTLTEEEMENIYRLSDGLAISSVVHDLLAHAAAQGRAIAAKDARIAEMEVEMDRLAKRPWATSNGLNLPEWEARAKRAESALATLRQAGTAYYEATSMDVGAPPKTLREAQAERRAFKAALDATPAEHPDTAALHELQTRLKEALEGANDEDFGFWISTADANELRSLLGDSGPSGGGEKPTTPPYVAASEPTPEKDWQRIEEALSEQHERADDYAADCERAGRRQEASGVRAQIDRLEAGLAALARLKAEPRRAAEDDALEEVAQDFEMLTAGGKISGLDAADAVRRRKSIPARRFVEADEVLRAAEDMRERCARMLEQRGFPNLAKDIRALPL